MKHAIFRNKCESDLTSYSVKCFEDGEWTPVGTPYSTCHEAEFMLNAAKRRNIISSEEVK